MKARMILIFMGVTLQLWAQQKYVGAVLESGSLAPIPFATVAINSEGKFSHGVNANDQGRFEFTANGFDFIEISAVGFKTRKISFLVLQKQAEITVVLFPETQILEEVIVTEKKKRTTFSNTKKVFNLDKDIQQSGLSGIEIFDLVPEIQTNFSSGTISLRGSDNVSVFINGQPTAITPFEAMQQIPASRIQSIEVITSPSAKYRSEGVSGIINIVLVKEQNKGINLNVQSSVGTRRYGAALNGNYVMNNINLRLNGSYNSARKLNFQDIERDFLPEDTKENIESLYVFDGDVIRFGGGVDLTLGKRHQLSISTEYTDDGHTNNITSNFTDVSDSDDFILFRENTHEHAIFNLNPNYRFNIKENQFVEIDYNLDSSTNQYPLTDFENGEAVNGQILDEDYRLQSLSIDYHRPFGKILQMDAGIFRYTQDLESGQEITVPADSIPVVEFDYSEEIIGGYTSIEARLKKLGINLGLRYEDFTSNALSSELNIFVNQNFQNLFPTAHLTVDLNETTKASLGYSKRISRPNFHQVNALQIVNPLFLWEYNPNIVPETSNNLDFNLSHFSKSSTFNFTLSYRNRKNTILWVEFSDGQNQIFRYENSGQFNTLGVEGSFKYTFNEVWQTQFSGNVYLTNVEEKDKVTYDKQYVSRLQLRNSFKISKNLNSSLQHFLWPKNRTAFSETATRQRVDFTLGLKSNDSRLRCNLRVVDVFNSNKILRNSVTTNLLQHTEWDIQDITRNFVLSLSYDLLRGNEFKTKRLKRTYNALPID